MLAEVNRDLKVKDILSLTINTSAIEELRTTFKALTDAQAALLFSQGEGSLSTRRASAEAEIKTIQGQLGEKQRLYLVYKDQLTQWDLSKAALQGHKEKGGTIAWINAAARVLICCLPSWKN